MKKMKSGYFIFIMCIAVLIILLTVITCIFIKKTPVDEKPVYAVMITGKDKKRLEFAKLAVKNFQSQSYNNKYLIIINHGERKITQDLVPNILEVYMDKHDHTLGDLRNIALDLVAVNAYWTTWDDDDWRSNTYLETLMTYANNDKNNKTITVITSRLEYNYNTHTSWAGYKPNGFVLFTAPKDLRVQYKHLDTMEDLDILHEFKKLGYIIKYVNNNPFMYLRLVHDNNTSLYVDKSKSYIIKGTDYYERYTSNKEKEYISNILSSYYNDIIDVGTNK